MPDPELHTFRIRPPRWRPPFLQRFPIQTERGPSADAENMCKAHVFVPFV